MVDVEPSAIADLVGSISWIISSLQEIMVDLLRAPIYYYYALPAWAQISLMWMMIISFIILIGLAYKKREEWMKHEY